MPDDTNALVPLSGKTLALSLTDEQYDETTQWRHHNAPVFSPLEVPQVQVQVRVVLMSQACQAGHPHVCLPLWIHLLRQGELGAGLQQLRL